MINCIFDNMPTRHVNYLLDDKRQNQKYCVCIVFVILLQKNVYFLQYNVTIMFLALSLPLSPFTRFKWGAFPLSFILFLTFYYLSQGCKDNIKLDIQQFRNLFLTQCQKLIALLVGKFFYATC